MLTDPIADMLSRIRNANQALHDSASMPTSKMKEEIARMLRDEGYIKDFRVVEATDDKGQPLPYRMLVSSSRATVVASSRTSSASPSPAAASTRARTASRASSVGSGRRSCPPPSG